jgi:hypothetical protein
MLMPSLFLVKTWLYTCCTSHACCIRILGEKHGLYLSKRTSQTETVHPWAGSLPVILGQVTCCILRTWPITTLSRRPPATLCHGEDGGKGEGIGTEQG